jgi:hypothetical protein
MKLSKVVEVGAALGAATLAGFNAVRNYKEAQEEHKHKGFKPGHIALYSSLFATGLAIWDIKRHHRAAA